MSQSATNGFALGVNSGSGNTREAPWLTLDYAVANAPSGSVIEVNDGTYASATWLDINNKGLTIYAARRRKVIVTGANTARVINIASSSTNRTTVLIGLVIDANGVADRNVTIGVSTSTATLTVTLRECLLKGADTGYVLSNSQKALNLTIEDCEAEGTVTQYPIDIRAIESGDVVIDGLKLTATTTSTAVKRMVWMNAVASGPAFHARRLRGTFSSSAASGTLQGIYCQNVDNALIEECNISVTNENQSATGIVVVSTSATITANDAIIRNNTVYASAPTGHGIIVGTDPTGDGNGNHNNAEIYGNVVTGDADASANFHGIMLGWGEGGDVHDNTVIECGLATLAKEQIGGEFRANTIHRAGSEALRAKGATGTRWEGNTVYVTEGFEGECVSVTANDAPTETPSTGIEVVGNTFVIDAAAPIVDVHTGSDATFEENTYLINATLGADPWKYQGTAYQTLEAWKAAVEPTAHP